MTRTVMLDGEPFELPDISYPPPDIARIADKIERGVDGLANATDGMTPPVIPILSELFDFLLPTERRP